MFQELHPELSPFSIDPHQDVPANRPKESFEQWFSRVSAISHRVEQHLKERGRHDWADIDIPVLLSQWRTHDDPEHYLELTERLVHVLGGLGFSGALSPADFRRQLVSIDIWIRAQSSPYAREITLRALLRRYRQEIPKDKLPETKAADPEAADSETADSEQTEPDPQDDPKAA